MTPSRRPRRLAVITMASVLAATGLGLSACGKSGSKDAAKPRASLTITTTPARTGSLDRTVEASGTVVAWQDVSVGAETGGLTATQLFVDEGDYVRQGQILVQMNDTVLVAQRRQREASVASAKASLAQAGADLTRASELKAQGYLAQAALDQKLAAQQTAAANLALAQASLSEVQARLGQASVRAPVAGLIAQRLVVPGQIVDAGKPLFRIVRDGRLELNAEVPEADLAQIRAGQPAVVSTSAVGEGRGHVRIVTPQVDSATRVGLARVAIDGRGAFRPGMFAKAVIDIGAQPALLAPQVSILYRDNKPGVYVIDRGGVAHFRPIVTGARSGDDVEVRSGLTVGESVAVQGAGFLAEGDRVRIVAAQAGGR